jgi:hypothetical protein
MPVGLHFESPLSDLNFITVTMHAHKLTGAYNLLILGSVADGEHSIWRRIRRVYSLWLSLQASWEVI